jgi:septal ring factor EnvC (AmiA/AmiB activator)
VTAGRWRRLLVAALLALLAAPAVPGDEAPEQELEELRERLELLRDRQRADLSERDSRVAELRETELALNGVTGELAALAREAKVAKARRDELDAALARRNDELAAERDALRAQLQALYRAGPAQPLRVLLMQENPAGVSRLLTWHDYLSRYRADAVARLAAAVSSLQALREARDAETERLEQLAERRRGRQQALERIREERGRLVAALEAGIRQTEQEIAQIEQREQQLLDLLEDLAELFSDAPSAQLEQPFPERRGALSWPVQGRLIADYGESRVGNDLRWNGLMIAAERGTTVQAVGYGRVAYADWLPGLGLLMILEHGDGYLSLYGHNDTLLREVGDWVSPGEAIATVGDSGGLPRPTLYFEIREGRRQVNPQRWFSTRLPR